MSEQWVDVAFVDGEDYDEIADFGTQEMAEYLSQWDYGQETDDARILVRSINLPDRGDRAIVSMRLTSEGWTTSWL